MESRDELHRLVDALPERQAMRAKRLLKLLLEEAKEDGDPFLRALRNAPIDDEPITPEEEAAVQEALREVASGEVLTTDELRREPGHEAKKR